MCIVRRRDHASSNPFKFPELDYLYSYVNSILITIYSFEMIAYPLSSYESVLFSLLSSIY